MGRKRGGGTQRIVITPFANTYELQQQTGEDFGFLEGERFPGFGGNASGLNAVLVVNGLTIECRDAAVEIRARLGLVVGGRISCPLEEAGDASIHTVSGLAARINAHPGWVLRKRHMVPSGPDGEAIKAVFDELAALSAEQPGEFIRVPLIGWRSSPDRAALDLNATVGRKPGNGGRRYELSFSVSSSCLDHALGYQFVSDRQELDRPEYADLANLRAFYSYRAFGDIPWAERVALTYRYVTKLCENTATWD